MFGYRLRVVALVAVALDKDKVLEARGGRLLSFFE